MKLNGKWKRLSGAVYESNKGVRVHTGGLIMFNSSEKISINSLRAGTQTWIHWDKSLKMNGYNRKRALMHLAEEIIGR